MTIAIPLALGATVGVGVACLGIADKAEAPEVIAVAGTAAACSYGVLQIVSLAVVGAVEVLG